MKLFLQAGKPSVQELAQRSEFIGIIHGNPRGMVTGDETQYVLVSAAEAVKGRRPSGWDAYPYLYVAPGNRFGYTNRLPERSEALVFARQGRGRDRQGWVAVAVFPLRYVPMTGKRVIALLGGGMYGTLSLPMTEVRRLLPSAIRGDATAAQRLDPILATVSQAIEALPRFLQQESILEDTQAVVARIERGTTRGDIEKLFPQPDGGYSFAALRRYYREPEVMVEVPYDQKGGDGRPTNRVNSPLRVYRDSFHLD